MSVRAFFRRGAVARLVAVAPVVVALGASWPALSQSDYPDKPIEPIIPFSPGGGVDLFGRTVARVLNEEGIVDENIQITNMPGAGGPIRMAELVQNRTDDPDRQSTRLNSSPSCA